MAKVKVNHSGSCEGYFYTKGEVVDLPENVLKAIGQANYVGANEQLPEAQAEVKQEVVEQKPVQEVKIPEPEKVIEQPKGEDKK